MMVVLSQTLTGYLITFIKLFYNAFNVESDGIYHEIKVANPVSMHFSDTKNELLFVHYNSVKISHISLFTPINGEWNQFISKDISVDLQIFIDEDDTFYTYEIEFDSYILTTNTGCNTAFQIMPTNQPPIVPLNFEIDTWSAVSPTFKSLYLYSPIIGYVSSSCTFNIDQDGNITSFSNNWMLAALQKYDIDPDKIEAATMIQRGMDIGTLFVIKDTPNIDDDQVIIQHHKQLMYLGAFVSRVSLQNEQSSISSEDGLSSISSHSLHNRRLLMARGQPEDPNNIQHVHRDGAQRDARYDPHLQPQDGKRRRTGNQLDQAYWDNIRQDLRAQNRWQPPQPLDWHNPGRYNRYQDINPLQSLSSDSWVTADEELTDPTPRPTSRQRPKNTARMGQIQEIINLAVMPTSKPTQKPNMNALTPDAQVRIQMPQITPNAPQQQQKQQRQSQPLDWHNVPRMNVPPRNKPDNDPPPRRLDQGLPPQPNARTPPPFDLGAARIADPAPRRRVEQPQHPLPHDRAPRRRPENPQPPLAPRPADVFIPDNDPPPRRLDQGLPPVGGVVPNQTPLQQRREVIRNDQQLRRRSRTPAAGIVPPRRPGSREYPLEPLQCWKRKLGPGIECYINKYRYDVTRKLGFGSDGDVYIAKQYLRDKVRDVALKQFTKKTSFERETRMLIALKECPYATHLLDMSPITDDYGITAAYFVIVMDYVAGGDLRKFMLQPHQSVKSDLPIAILRRYLLDLSEPLSIMNDNLNFMHTDIKPENILVFLPKVGEEYPDDEPNIDFILADMSVSLTYEQFTAGSYAGTAYWFSPEMASAAYAHRHKMKSKECVDGYGLALVGIHLYGSLCAPKGHTDPLCNLAHKFDQAMTRFGTDLVCELVIFFCVLYDGCYVQIYTENNEKTAGI